MCRVTGTGMRNSRLTRGSRSATSTSDVDRMHSKLFEQRTGRGSLLARATREGDLRISIFPEVGLLSSHANPSPDLAFVQSITCGADAVVIGVQQTSQSFLSENQEWIFTDNSASVREILKDNPTHPLIPGSTIIIARSGGRIDTPPGEVETQTPHSPTTPAHPQSAQIAEP